MISRIHSKLGTAGFIVSIVALVAALGGGAYAAKQAGLNSKQKSQVRTIAKEEAKKNPGTPGAPGAPGAAGAKGDTGAQGPEGKEGPEGPEGPQGPKGATGSQGPEGSPWTAGGILPTGKTETGVWGGVINEKKEDVKIAEQASFSIPLASAPLVNLVQKDGTATTGSLANCPGSVTNPQAKPGNFCLYTITNAEEPEGLGFGAGTTSSLRSLTTGVLFQANIPAFNPETFSISALGGTWAVTAGP